MKRSLRILFLFLTLSAQPTLASSVKGRFISYNSSRFHNVIDSRKVALLPGVPASLSNYTSYAGGITGIMVDIANCPRQLELGDFVLRVGNDSNPLSWGAAPAATLSYLRGGGEGGLSDRYLISFSLGTIRNKWLQVIVKPGVRTQLPAQDVFYFGNFAGEVTGDFLVNATDAIAIRNNAATRTVVFNPYDLDKDGEVNASDERMANSFSGAPWRLQRITPPQFQNTLNALDTNGDGIFTAADALGMSAPTSPPPALPRFFDVNGDGDWTPLDVLMIANCLNSPACNTP